MLLPVCGMNVFSPVATGRP